MKKNVTVVLICFFVITLVFSACASAKNHRNDAKNAASVNNVGISKNQLVNQEITALSSLKTPDKIVYYHNGQEKIFKKGDTKFKRIMELNAQRDQGKLERLKGVILLDNNTQGNILVYNYGEFGYEPLYFPLSTPSDGKYIVAQPTTPEASAAQEYGFLSAPDQLLHYLNG